MDDFSGIQKRQNPLEAFFGVPNLKTSPFGENRSAERAYERAERIVAALYLLTNHLSHTEPLRTSIRSEAIRLLDVAISVRDELRSSSSERLNAFRASIRSLASLVRMLAISGSISMQNAQILMESLDELGTFLTSARRSTLSESISLTRNDLDVPGSLIGHGRPARAVGIKDIRDSRDIKDRTGVKDMTDISGKPREFTPRQENILQILRAGGLLGIREISSLVPQYSEKMVQRELAALVAQGRVQKQGSKRWSRYSFLA